MFLKQLHLIQFKNFDKLDIALSEGINIFTGNNGQGKTNLLDAIYLLCMTKSYFQYSEKNIVQFGKDFFRAKGIFIKDNKDVVIDCKYKLPGQKSFIKDDKDIKKYASYIGFLPIVIITPGDIQLIEEGSEERRRFMDISICQIDPIYTENLTKYNKLLKQRNSLLKNMNQQKLSQNELLEFYNEEMAKISVTIVHARQKFTDEIANLYQDIYGSLTDKVEKVRMQYQPDCIGDISDFLKLYIQNKGKDLLLERTTHGIHKDDLEFVLEDKPVKRIGSQGQIKSTIFAAKLSQYQWLKNASSTLPILLLDDIFDKLDHDRVTNLMKIIDDNIYGQIFITDTYRERVRSILPKLNKKSICFNINKGNISQYE